MNIDVNKTYIGDSDQYLLCYLNTDAGDIPDPRYKGTKEEVIDYLVSVSQFYAKEDNYDLNIEKCRRYYTSRFQHVINPYRYSQIPDYDNNAESDDDESYNDYIGWVIYRL